MTASRHVLILVGTRLAGIVSALAGAEQVVISDYPAPEILANIRTNIEKNLPTDRASSVFVRGHEWGVINDDFSANSAQCFTRVLAADCL